MSEVKEQVLQIDDIEAMAVGTWILGTGGGGSPYLNLLNIRELYAAGRRVTLKDPMTLPDDALVAVLSFEDPKLEYDIIAITGSKPNILTTPDVI